MTFEDAIKFVRKTIQEDDGLRILVAKTIAMRLHDTTTLPLEEKDNAADQIMNLLFHIPLP